MIQPTEPTYGVFLTLISEGEDESEVVARPVHLPVVAYATASQALTPHFLPPGHVQTYDVFGARDMLGGKDTHTFFLGLLIPDAAVPETSLQQLKVIIENARDSLERARDYFESVVLSEELETWLGKSNGK